MKKEQLIQLAKEVGVLENDLFKIYADEFASSKDYFYLLELFSKSPFFTLVEHEHQMQIVTFKVL